MVSVAETEEMFRLLDQVSDDQLEMCLREAWEKLDADSGLFEPDRSLRMLRHITPVAADEPEGKTTIGFARRITVIKKLAAVACLLILIALGLYFEWIPKGSDGQLPVAQNAIKHSSVNANNATLTLANGKTIVLGNTQRGTLLTMPDVEVTKAEGDMLVYKAKDNSTRYSGRPSLNTVSTPRGRQFKIILPDGSKVWLNAASSLTFPTLFAGASRQVALKGEAYFEIAKDENKSFIVSSKHSAIEVLGTHFNVMAYEDERTMKTTLLEGAVKITSDNAMNVLKPGEQAIVNRKNVMRIVNDVDVNKEIAWVDGLFQFNNTDVESIMRQAARWYDLNVHYEGEVGGKSFTGKIPRSVDVSEFLEMLTYAGVRFRVDGNDVTVLN